MKKISSLLLISFSILFFTACSKDSGDDDGGGNKYYIKANIDGTKQTYTANPLAIKLDQDGTYSYAMSAGNNSGEGLGLQITQTSGPVMTGSYNADDVSGDYVIGAVYNPGTSDIAGIFGAGLKTSDTPLQIVLSSVTDSEISGTFSGEFFDNSGSGTNSIFITNGEFNLPIQ